MFAGDGPNGIIPLSGWDCDCQGSELIRCREVGEVSFVEVPGDKGRRNHGYANVEFETSRDADAAMRRLQGELLMGRPMRIRRGTMRRRAQDGRRREERRDRRRDRVKEPSQLDEELDAYWNAGQEGEGNGEGEAQGVKEPDREGGAEEEVNEDDIIEDDGM